MPRRLVVTLVWLAGTAVAVLLATSAVGLVGERVASRPIARVSSKGVEQALQTDTTSGGDLMVDALGNPVGATSGSGSSSSSGSGASQSAGGTDGGSGTAGGPSSPTVAPSGSSSQSSGDGQSSGGGPGPGGGSGSGSTPGGPGSTTTVPQTPVDAVYSVAGGSVGVRCVGSIISLRYATPTTGYSVEQNSTGPGQVDIRFRPFGSGGGDEVRVRAECRSGSPSQIS